MGRTFDALTFGPARRRRRMSKRLAQLDDVYRYGASIGGPSEWRGPGGFAPAPARASGGGGRLLLVVAMIVVLVAGVVVAARGLATRSEDRRPGANASRYASPLPVSSASPGRAHVNGAKLPPPGVGEAPDRLLPLVAAPAGSGGYRFESERPGGGPMTYDPCRAIHYVVRPTNAPPGGQAIIEQSIRAVSAATGLQFVFDGSTSEAPSTTREAFQPERYGERWAPVLITWSSPRESRTLAGTTLGYGGSQALTLTSGSTSEAGYVTGSVTLDAPDLRRTEAQAGTRGVRAVVEHELGHVVGLGHVTDQRQLMYPETGLAVFDYQAGDRRGLAALGDGPCTPEI